MTTSEWQLKSQIKNSSQAFKSHSHGWTRITVNRQMALKKYQKSWLLWKRQTTKIQMMECFHKDTSIFVTTPKMWQRYWTYWDGNTAVLRAWWWHSLFEFLIFDSITECVRVWVGWLLHSPHPQTHTIIKIILLLICILPISDDILKMVGNTIYHIFPNLPKPYTHRLGQQAFANPMNKIIITDVRKLCALEK